MSWKRWAGALGMVGALGVTTAAIAGLGGQPKFDQVDARITYTLAEIKERSCGPDDAFTEQRVRLFGTSQGSAALSGDVEVRVKLLNENATGESFQTGKLVIRDPSSGRTKVVARFTDAGVAEIFQGVLVGTAHRGNKTLIANWRTTFHPNGAVTVEIGGEAGDARLPAIVTRGGCKGPFERSVLEVPPPEDAAAANQRTSTKRVGLRYR